MRGWKYPHPDNSTIKGEKMKQTRQGPVWLVVFFLVCWMNIDAGQAATRLDAGFGRSGFVVKDFGSGEDEIFAIAPQTDGKIVVVGQYDNGAVKNIAVARYLPTGELDISFNDDGIFTHSIGSADTRARSLAIQGDGRIVVAGSANDGADNIVLVRLTADGFLDNSFAANGQYLLPISGGKAEAYAVQIAGNGEILVAGTVTMEDDAGTYGIVAKVTANGQLVPGFGEEGVVAIKYDYDAEVRSLVIQDDGKAVVAGSFAPDGATARAGVLRLDPDGGIDGTYGENGRLLLTMEGNGSIIHDLTLDAEGGLYAVGENRGSFPETFVAGVTADGGLDQGFAASGIYRSTLAAENVGKAISLDEAGNLLVAGFAETDRGKDVFLLTIYAAPPELGSESASGNTGADSTLNSVFGIAAAGHGNMSVRSVFSGTTTSRNVAGTGNGGLAADYQTADLANTTDVGNALAVMPGGVVFVAGATGTDADKDFALLRFVPDQALSVTGTTSDGEGVTAAGYTIVTRQVTEITRVGAKSGGTIIDVGTQQCTNTCTANCSSAADPATCFTTCFATCRPAAVSQRGVVFGIVSGPVLREESTDDDDSDDDSDTGTETTGNVFIAQVDRQAITFPESDTFTFDLVESGRTQDGSGTGSFGSVIRGITPNTVYFVRAYARLSDGTVIYGNEHVFRTDDACFIATAAFGSMLDGHVRILREFRDKVLMTGGFGRQLVAAYYQLSPRFADLIEKYEVLRSIVRVILVPFVIMAYFILKTGLVAKVCALTALVALWPLKSRVNIN